MKLLALLILFFLVELQGIAAVRVVNSTRDFHLADKYSLSTVSHRKPLKHCYRWMKESEAKDWKSGVATLYPYRGPDMLGRTSPYSDVVAFCWSNPVTGRIGGLLEEYGDYLLRIDLDPNAITFDRNQDKYFRGQEEVLGVDPEKRGTGTALVYANYLSENLLFFQEYMVRSDSIIVGWTFNDLALRSELSTQLDRLRTRLISLDEFHYFYNYFDHPKALFSEENGYEFYTSTVLAAYNNVIQKYWADPNSEQYFVGPASKKVCGQKVNCLVEPMQWYRTKYR